MKKLINLALLLATVCIIQACNNDEVSDPPPAAPVEKDDSANQDTVDQNENAEATFHFTNFDLDVDYPDNKNYDVDYDNEQEGMEAEIEDTLNQNNLTGDEAFEELKPKFEKLTFDQNTKNEDVLSEVKDVFEINDDYTRIKVEVEFADGTEKEYSEQK
ncbi:YusW family protein [Metabacillus niabensis]|uniref:YusW family protein n=1 Tax=Metabacillus niabensis TaxID=324854 RepID=UPI001CFACD15|nr:YusW family protein [Metabacillus niabensis]